MSPYFKLRTCTSSTYIIIQDNLYETGCITLLVGNDGDKDSLDCRDKNGSDELAMGELILNSRLTINYRLCRLTLRNSFFARRLHTYIHRSEYV